MKQHEKSTTLNKPLFEKIGDIQNYENENVHKAVLKALETEDVRLYFDDALENQLVLNMGPQHPATHGVLRLVVSLDGEKVINVVPDVGYLHRGYEKIAENMTFHEYIPHTDRLDYLSPIANNVCYVSAVEKLLELEIPIRAKYIRVIACELARLASHLVWLGTMAMDVGALTVFLWCFTEREKILDIFDILTGVRFTTTYTRVGGLYLDISEECINRILKFLDGFEESTRESQKMLDRNRIFINRCEGVGHISKDDALQMGLTGPLLRAAGIERDLRRDEPYLVYNELDFDIPTLTESDVLARYYVRLQEMFESRKILLQCIDKLPKGPINADSPTQVLPDKGKVYTKMEELINDFMIVNFGNMPKAGAESYFAIEASKGELGFYLISDGTGHPFRLKIRSPSFINIQTLPIMMKRCLISDIVSIIGGLDPVMGECDK